MQNVDPQHQPSQSTTRGWTAIYPDSIWANWSNSSMEGMLLLVVLHPTASSMLSLKTQEAYRVDQEGQWEVDWDVKGGGSSLNCFCPRAVLCYSGGPAAAPEERLAVVYVPCDHHTALCCSLWQLQGMGLQHWLFIWKIITFRRKFHYPGKEMSQGMKISSTKFL